LGSSTEGSGRQDKALATTDHALKADFVEMEKAWLELAKNFEALKSMEDFPAQSFRGDTFQAR
jgi:hypothetical protein